MRITSGILIGAALAASALAQPPIIDRELLFGDPEIAASQISPDGKYIAFLKPFNKTRNIWVKKTTDPFEAAKLLTNEPNRPIPQFFWSRDGKFVLFVKDQGGDENYNVYAVDPAASPAAGSEVPAARNLTDAKGVRAALYAVPRSEPDIMYVGLNDRDKAWHDLYKGGRVREGYGRGRHLRRFQGGIDLGGRGAGSNDAVDRERFPASRQNFGGDGANGRGHHDG